MTAGGEGGGTEEGGDELNQYRRVDYQVDTGTPAEFDRTHDLDGNLTEDGSMRYV